MMAFRFPAAPNCLTAILVATAMIAVMPTLALAQDPRDAPSNQEKKSPEQPSQLPKARADRTRGLDFLFGARNAALDEGSCKYVEARIWALWMQTPSDA